MIRASMSKLELLSRCGYWAREGVPWTRLSNADATFGIAMHASAEGDINGKSADLSGYIKELGDEAWTKLAPVLRFVSDWIALHRRIGWRAEVAFAIDVESGAARELTDDGEHRDYETMGADLTRELPGTADIVYMSADSGGPFACVDDWKWSGFHGDELRAESQLAGLGLAVARAWNVDRVRCRALRVSDDGVDDTSEVYWLDAFDLDRVHEELRERMAAIPTSEPNDGPWCRDRWCAAVTACPKTATAIEQVIPASALVREMRLSSEIQSVEHAAWTHSALEMVEEAVSVIRASLKKYADDEGGIPLADGSIYAGTEVTTERPDLAVPGAVEELRAMGVAAAVKSSVTWADIKRVGAEGAENQAREVLRAIGATKTTSHRKYEARMPKRARLPKAKPAPRSGSSLVDDPYASRDEEEAAI